MKKQLFTVILIVFTNCITIGQTASVLETLESKNNSPENFYEIQKKFNDFAKNKQLTSSPLTNNGKPEKIPNWNLFKRWEYYWEQRVDRVTGEFPKTNAIVEYAKTENSLKKKSTYNENWTNLGTTTSDGGYAGLGRINCIAFHPTDNNTFWVGSPSGGLWKTTNGGSSWAILNNNLSVLGVSDIVLTNDYATSNTMYIVTGDRDGGSMWSLGGGQVADNASVGILKSTDGGATWNATGLTYTASNKKLVYRLLIHPSNNQILIATTTDGIQKSTDGGATWSVTNVNRFIDMEFKPGDPSIVYASTVGYSSAYVFRSTNTGDTWSIAVTVTNGRRSELAVTANDPTVVYQLVANSGGGVLGIYKSTNSGASFAQVNTNGATNPGMLGYYSDGSGAATG
ncbi:MAG: exo-alpha-sialidase, partial [Ignavibacteriales bacterium]|nr:exo-alpha-sialidase [Ignavibacteriales bacterium]